jgi:hypothetical protein
VLCTALLGAPALLVAQGTATRSATRPATGPAVATSALPPNWKMRLDRDNLPADYKLSVSGSELHATTVRAAGIFYDPRATATGTYRAEATLTQTRAPAHPEAYGLFVGGTGLDTPRQDYLYFVVRGDGKYLVKHRAGEATHTLADWTTSPAVKSADATGKATNALRIDVARDSVRFFVNGTRVTTLPRVMRTDGTVGLRINHALDLMIEGPKITPTR